MSTPAMTLIWPNATKAQKAVSFGRDINKLQLDPNFNLKKKYYFTQYNWSLNHNFPY